MKEDTASPQINSAKLRVGGNIAGAIFTVGSMLIFLFGIPVLRYMFPVAVLFGCGIALAFRVIRHETPGKPWLRSAIEENTEVFRKPEREGHSGGSARVSSALHRAVDFRARSEYAPELAAALPIHLN